MIFGEGGPFTLKIRHLLADFQGRAPRPDGLALSVVPYSSSKPEEPSHDRLPHGTDRPSLSFSPSSSTPSACSPRRNDFVEVYREPGRGPAP
jgi:hypothetical protein